MRCGNYSSVVYNESVWARTLLSLSLSFCPMALQSRLSILLCVLMMVLCIAAIAQAMRGSRHEKGENLLLAARTMQGGDVTGINKQKGSSVCTHT